jgi:hypothetical protein
VLANNVTRPKIKIPSLGGDQYCQAVGERWLGFHNWTPVVFIRMTSNGLSLGSDLGFICLKEKKLTDIGFLGG